MLLSDKKTVGGQPMEQVWIYLDQALDFISRGYANVNAVQGLLIALGATYLLNDYRRILAISLGASLSHLAVDILLPVLADGAAFRLPPIFSRAYLEYALSLFVGYVVVISIFFLVKRFVFRR